MDGNKIQQYEAIRQHRLLTPEEEERINNSFSENALKMMKKRYLLRDEQGTILENPAQMLHRIAHALADVEKQYGKNPYDTEQIEKDFFYIMANKEFTPAGRTITNAGAPSPVVANCIVLPIKDSMDGIFQTLKDAAMLQKAGSGLGFSFTHLRPAGSIVKKSQGMASGPISFLQVYNQAFGVIKQQGRHGANMAILRVDHPDILDFIHCKRVEGDIRNFNISVGMTDEFMDAVINRPNEPWLCKFDGEIMKPRRITRDSHGLITNIEELDMTAKEMMDEIVYGAWRNGEPGVVFLDVVNKTNPLPELGEIDACNPCGEQFLHHYDVCNLGSINLAAFVKNGRVDYDRLRFVTRTATRLLDNVVDSTNFPVKAVDDMSRNSRRLGLGIMGFADMLYQMHIRYDSPEGYAMAESVMRTIQEEAHQTSQDLAKEKGVFPLYDLSIYKKLGIPMRNTMVTTVAPTGSISMFFDTASGCEPNFALAYTKQDKDRVKYLYVNQYLEKELKDRGLYTQELMDQIIQEGSVTNISGLPEDIKETYRVSMDISAESHIRVQASFQKWVDNSISKTINFPYSATQEDVIKGYILAWQMGCKGCTVYRDGSRELQVLNINKNMTADGKTIAPTEASKTLAQQEPSTPAPQPQPTPMPNPEPIKPEQPVQPKMVVNNISPRKRPDVMQGSTYKITTAYGNLYVTINEDQFGAFEVFSQLGKAGGFFGAQTEAICRMISLALRSGISIGNVIEQLKGIRGPDPVFHNGERILSLPDAIANVLENHLKRGQTELKLEFPKVAAPEGRASLNGVERESPKIEVKQPVYQTVTTQPEASSGMTYTQKASIADMGHAPACPDCSSMMVMAEGCMKCEVCGYSKCG
ncbi:MAG TPA: adenosylcobalamin-dependent ribonucleoside-diphosphate reductase [Patescibacteria group bacterium]|nr:adenosylcobalamin-dependent ribonucleoside-diphosphate reductase [Patescibacteria group bacterium]